MTQAIAAGLPVIPRKRKKPKAKVEENQVPQALAGEASGSGAKLQTTHYLVEPKQSWVRTFTTHPEDPKNSWRRTFNPT